jgi:transposase
MDQLAKIFHVSKGTVVNVIHNYPYASTQEDYTEREYRNMRNMLSAIVGALKTEAGTSRADMIQLASIHQQEVFLMSLASENPAAMLNRIKKERLNTEKTAWEALDKGDYIVFAHNAKLWTHLNDIAGDQKKNPFQEIREKTNPRNKACSLRFSGLEKLMTDKSTIRKPVQTASTGTISDALWKEIRTVIDSDKRIKGNQPADPRIVLPGLLYAMRTGCSLRQIPPIYGKKSALHQYWQCWWYQGLFQLLWEICPKWPELQAVSGSLANMEKYRIAFPGKLPKFYEIMEGEL